MRNVHSMQAELELKVILCLLQLCALPRQRNFNHRHKHEIIFTSILLKVIKWQWKWAYFWPFWECCCWVTHPTVIRDTFLFAKSPPASSRTRAGQEPLQANLLGVSQPRWGLPGWGCAPVAHSAGHSCLIQRHPAPSGEVCRAPEWLHFGRRCARRAPLLMTEWGLWDLSIIRNSPTRRRWWTWPAGAYPLRSVRKRGAGETRESKSLLNSF